MILRVLAALDGSPRAPCVFDTAAEIAARFCATLFPFRALFIPPEFPAAAAGHLSDALPDHLTKLAADELLQLSARPAPAGVRIDAPTVRFGTPWRQIIEMSEELDVDLIVLGSHGYQGLDRILGTTAARVVNLARRNVYVVHERTAHEAPLERPGSPHRKDAHVP